jgi:hypothetical protein
MKDKSIFPKVKELFSTDVVIRRSGGKRLSVSDFNAVQAFGNLQSNQVVSKYNRLYNYSTYNSTYDSGNYANIPSRPILYAKYEQMDTDGIISKALDVLAEEATQKNEIGEVLSIRSSSENIQQELYHLFYNVLNIEFNLPMWIRSMTKYGDHFQSLKVTEGVGVYNTVPLSVYEMVREEGQDANNADYIRFVRNKGTTAGDYNVNLNTQEADVYENYEIAHFRMLKDANFYPYGKSWLEPARKLYDQYVLLEDAAILHRVTRSAEKRIFYYNVGGIPPNEVDAFMQKQLQSMKKAPLIDPATGQYNLKYNMQNMMEDFHIPRRNGDTTTTIDTAKGLEYAGMDDINYFLQKLLTALGVPKAFLNYSDELNGKSTLSGLSLSFSKSIEYIQRLVIKELQKIASVHLIFCGYPESDIANFKLSLTVSSILAEQEKIALLKEKFSLMGDIIDKKLVSSDWCYDNIFKMSEDQINTERELIAEDVKRTFRYSQIEGEGNDPAISGISYGTPHDLASIYKNNAAGKPATDLPTGYDEEEKVGRPKKYLSTYGTDKSNFGRDPLGKVDTHDTGDKEKASFNNRVKPLALESKMYQEIMRLKQPKVCVLFEKEEEPLSILDERNILDI